MPKSILICDDEQELAEELAEFFLASGWRVEICFSVPMALHLLSHDAQPDCILTDLRVAQYSGADIIKAVRSRPQELPPILIALMTGHVLGDMQASDFGADLFYVKPIDPACIMDEIESTLRQAATGTNRSGD